MKAITILQPFATLIAIGEKHFETRSWSTKYCGDLLIHAGKGKDYMFLCNREPFKSVLKKHGYDKDNLPLGSIIAKTDLMCCMKIIDEKINSDFKVISATLENKWEVKGNELEFGYYSKGRYAWNLTSIEKLKEPMPVKGQQRLWNFDFKE